MVKYTYEELRRLMDTPNVIRNLSVIAHVDSGKTTMTDCLVAEAGIIAEQSVGTKTFMDVDMEKERGITIKSSAITLGYALEEQTYLINVVDCPGHVDFSDEVTAALRITDGAIVVIDAVDGVCVQTTTVLQQAFQEHIKPVLFINKLDRIIQELQMSPEECYKHLFKHINQVNGLITGSGDHKTRKPLDPREGNICFGSALRGWGFSLATFAAIYASKYGISEEKLLKNFWGDVFYDPKKKRFVKHNPKGQLKRTFVQFVLEPIYTIMNLGTKTELTEEDEKTIETICKTLGVSGERVSKKYAPKLRSRQILKTFCPEADTILKMIISHLPSPVEAQEYRCEAIYEGDAQDPYGKAFRLCAHDVNDPLIFYVSKMIPFDHTGRKSRRLITYGRVFSGVLKPNMPLRIMRERYDPSQPKDSSNDVAPNVKASLVGIMMGNRFNPMPSLPAGSICGILGIDDHILKSGTITNAEHLDCYPCRPLKFSVACVVEKAISPKHSKDLPKFVSRLKSLSKSYPLIKIRCEPTGEYIIAGAGDLHLSVFLDDFKEQSKLEIVESDCIIPYKETVTEMSSLKCYAKSPNKLNRLWMKAAPSDPSLTLDIENGKFNVHTDKKTLTTTLSSTYSWDASAAKIWCFGPEGDATNLFINATSSVQHIQTVRDTLCSTFHLHSQEGVLCEEPLRGVSFSLVDASFHSDNVHRNVAQLAPSMRRAMKASQLTASPRFQIPMMSIDITVPDTYLGAVYSLLSQSNGTVEGCSYQNNNVVISGLVPASSLYQFDFIQTLRANTSGWGFASYAFSHWHTDTADPLDPSSTAHELLLSIRKRKGLSDKLPELSTYHDRF